MTYISKNSSFVKIVALVILVTFLTGSAEIITLRDGSKIIGTITSQTNTEIIVKTSYGTLRLAKANILSIDYDAEKSQPSQQQKEEKLQKEEYDQGFRDGRTKGYQDGYQKGKSEQKSSRITGSLVGWLVGAVVTLAILLSLPSEY